ncbi:hypothetical protein IV498_05765 [Paenarthrobacter sp. Z7-10]|uniref:hypothetical protein n=1 Tax=Paenarthrobacter sp. Z7-10 TaxID=2787635 RepID=UPI0022A90691|nr:hypothetical protein [Paenarthrobacter sp. Z7-10]MCZ2402703.1 hypothetical protein [Paenarthrobacter sp. Z7-10]
MITGAGIGVSWATGYYNLHDLKAHSTIAVQGRFTRLVGQNSLKTIPLTDFEFTVDQVLHDPGNLVNTGAKLTVRQTGGTVNGVVQQTSDDPLFQISERNVLFLKQASPGLFYVIGGPTGRFEITNGTVAAFASNGASFTGSPADFAAAVKNS